MKHISSRDNPLYKRLLRLAGGKRDPQAGGSDREGQAIVLEGIHLCQAWLQHAGQPQVAFFDAERMLADTELRDLADALEPSTLHSCDPRLAKGLSQVEHGQGVYFLVTAPRPSLPICIDHNCIWLDRIQDPGNVGTLLRTAAAAGVGHAYLSRACAHAWSAKVLRSGQGAHFVMTIYEDVDLPETLARLAVPLIATSLDDAAPLYAGALPAACAWVFGNEGQGVQAALLARADRRVYIPQAANVESLNVATAAAICLFEQRRQHSF